MQLSVLLLSIHVLGKGFFAAVLFGALRVHTVHDAIRFQGLSEVVILWNKYSAEQLTVAWRYWYGLLKAKASSRIMMETKMTSTRKANGPTMGSSLEDGRSYILWLR